MAKGRGTELGVTRSGAGLLNCLIPSVVYTPLYNVSGNKGGGATGGEGGVKPLYTIKNIAKHFVFNLTQFPNFSPRAATLMYFLLPHTYPLQILSDPFFTFFSAA